MPDPAVILAHLDEIEPWPQEWPLSEQENLGLYLQVARARSAVAAAFYGMTTLQTMQVERTRTKDRP